VTYLLDTNVCIALINGRPAEVRTRFEDVMASGESIATSSVVVFELWYGVGKSARPEANAERLNVFLGGPIDVLEFDSGDAHEAGRIRAALEAIGRPSGAYDLLIAGQAVNRNARLVTSNCAEFARVADLAWEDWAVRSARPA
jgi:tRNA(fMet)-specific endonuclease VapC